MAIPHEQVIEVRARRADGKSEVGSGLLLPGGLALTAAHVVFSQSGAPFDPVMIRMASQREFVAASVIWPAERGTADAALLKITTPGWVDSGGVRAVRWGRITGSAPGLPCEAIGFPRVLREANTGRDTDHMTGSINPGNRLGGRRYDIHVTSRVPEAVGRPWAGMSGAAVFSGDLLIGIVIIETPGYAGGSLTAEPVASFANPKFVGLVTGTDRLELESVELTGMFGPPKRRSENHSRASLLDAATEVVPFRGREDLILKLWSWCRAEDDFAAQLIVGPGGQGKTRLARELCLRLRRDGWLAGLVHERVAPEVIGHLTETREPVLLAVDVAEARSDQIIALIEAAWRRPEHSAAIRLLMLARSDGDWWEQLRRRMPEPLRSAIRERLPELEENLLGRSDAYRDALCAFAERLDEAEPGANWPSLASRLEQPDGMADAKFGSVLDLHMTALMALLQAGPDSAGETSGRRPEDVLLDHEEQYWDESQKTYVMGVVRRSVAAATLCGAGDDADATRLLAGLRTLRQWGGAELAGLADLIHHLYPVPSGQFWGYLQPDRLGEHLIRRVTDGEPEFPDSAMAAASLPQQERAKAVFARIGARSCEDDRLTEAKQWYERAATAGHKDAAFKLGELLRIDRPGEARRWFGQAAAAGHNDAAYALGELLRESTPAEARQWYERAATAGHTNAAFSLGQLLWKQDKPAEAKSWFMRAAAAGHAEAAYELGWLLKKTEDDDLGTRYWWRTSADLGWHGAAYHLAQVLESRGKTDEAMTWYERAAPDHRDAAFTLAESLNHDGKLTGARHWYEQAAGNGHALAAFRLGCLMMETQDFKGAGYWWHKANELGHPEATPVEIGEMLWSKGWPAQAEGWFEEAAGQGSHQAASQLVYLMDSLGEPAKADHWRKVAASLFKKEEQPSAIEPREHDTR